MGFVKVRHADGREADITGGEVAFYRSMGFDPVEEPAPSIAGPGDRPFVANDPPGPANGPEQRLDLVLDEIRAMRNEVIAGFEALQQQLAAKAEEEAVMKYRHPTTGHEVEATEEQYASTLAVQGFVPVEEPPAEEGAPTLTDMTRDELNAHAASVGVEDPDSLPNKAAVIEAIEEREG